MVKSHHSGKLNPTLIRGQEAVTNLLSSFGQIRETNISSLLGYLIHLEPEWISTLIGKDIEFKDVRLEMRSDDGVDRYDIFLEGGRHKHVIEIKLDTHSASQLRRYSKSNKYVYTIGQRLGSHKVERSYSDHFFDWNQVVSALVKVRKNGKTANQFYNSLVDGFIEHLRENNMVKGKVEDIYLRDLSGPSVEIYFNQNFYQCQPAFYDHAKNMRYLAPYLTASNSRTDRLSVFRSLGVGISFISKIRNAFLGSEKEIWEKLTEFGYSKENKNLIFQAFKWKPNSKKRHAVLFLDDPMRLFQRPVTKPDIWGVAGGMMGSRGIDFGDLIAASNGLYPLSQENKKKAKKSKAKIR